MEQDFADDEHEIIHEIEGEDFYKMYSAASSI